MTLNTIRIAALACAIGSFLPLVSAQQNPVGLWQSGPSAVQDILTPLPPGQVQLRGGVLGDRFLASERHRLLVVDENDMLDAFEHRLMPHQDWQGEHVGKFLHAASIVWKTTGDHVLKAKITRVARRLIATQESDGYLGTYAPEKRWTSWDVWCHKYDLIGLLTYYQYTRDASALKASRRVGDLLVNTFGPGKRDINSAGEHMGMASDSVLEPIVLLYRATGDRRYLAFAKYIVSNYNAPGGPRILDSIEKTGSVTKVANGKAYEMISNFNGLLELYRVTGDRRLLKDMETAWNDIRAHRRYITGSMSAGEHFQADYELPNGEANNICETCVTVSWEQMNLHLLRLTGEARYADEAERTIYNHLLAAQLPGGDQWCYYTPLDGRKPYGNSTSCCLSSGPRGVALIPSIAVMSSRDGGLNVNLYTSADVSTVAGGRPVRVVMKTDYPVSGRVSLRVYTAKGAVSFPLRLRISAWTSKATVTVNGKRLSVVARPGSFAVVSRRWRAGDTVDLDLALAPRLIRGDHGNAGKATATYGPLVLAIDTSLNPGIRMLKQVALRADAKTPFKLDAKRSTPQRMVFDATGFVGSGAKPRALFLTPFATAGAVGGGSYQVWTALPGHNLTSGGSGSAFFGGRVTVSRRGNQEGDIADDDPSTFRVTYDGTKLDNDWFAVAADTPQTIDRVVFVQGRYYHDGGWFDTSGDAGKPRVQVRASAASPWVDVAKLDGYPSTTAADPGTVKEAQAFEARFAPVSAIAIRVIGRPGCGDNAAQNFSSCAELQGFRPR